MWAAILLVAGATDPVPPPGQIAFMREGKVWLIGADGSAERALTDTLFLRTERPITWMPDGRSVLFWNHSKVGWDIWTVTADGRAAKNLTQVKSGGCRSPAPSPDGKHIAFLRDNPAGLYLMGTDGQHQRRLTDKGFRDFAPAWSPDGKRLAYTALEDGKFFVYGHDLNSGRDARIARGSWPCWSPDGKRLVFVGVRDTSAVLSLISPDGRNEIRLTKGLAAAPAWSPDGKRIAYFAPRQHRVELRVVNVENKKDFLVASVDGPWWRDAPSWSQDGKWLTFGAGPSSGQTVYIVDVQGGSMRKLAAGGACYPSWRPNPRDGDRPR